MAVWVENLRRALQDRPVLLLHGNVRDRYIDQDQRVYENLTGLLTSLASQLPLELSEVLFYDPKTGDRREVLRPGGGGATAPTASAELAQPPAARGGLLGEMAQRQPEAAAPPPPTAGTDRNPAADLARWARDELTELAPPKLAVIFYLDKIVAYKSSYVDTELECLLWLEKILENLPACHRLVLVALSDTMLPVELYTHSPKSRVFAIPLPDKEARDRYLARRLGEHAHRESLALLTDGLYLRELDAIVGEVLAQPELSEREIPQLVNRYRVGVQEDYWGKLSIEKLDGAFEWFTQLEGVRGQDQAIRRIQQVLYRARAGLAGAASGTASKPKGTLFFAGPPGVGKTLLAKKLAKFLFGDEGAFVRLDMSEFKEDHTVSKLIGSPPGYVGYEQGGTLTNAVRERPFSVVLFDEIEKAHESILDIFLQLLDEGRLTDSRGQTVFFTETVVIFTSNIGNRAKERPVVDAILEDPSLTPEEREEAVRQHFLTAVQRYFELQISRPELLRRIGNNIVPFNHIRGDEVQRQIVAHHLSRIKQDFDARYRQLQYTLEPEPAVVDLLVARYGGEQMARFGGGGITNAIEDDVITALSQALLRAEYEGLTPATFRIVAVADRVEVRIE